MQGTPWLLEEHEMVLSPLRKYFVKLKKYIPPIHQLFFPVKALEKHSYVWTRRHAENVHSIISAKASFHHPREGKTETKNK